ncbi:MAG TPA: 23S rRNA (adenine(2503)-C(2))-methyltransferase RlmN [Candidatus Binatia bacterium]|nr:23S rRNA (adenine(2503)-C(2))-methyltransferase RlmN [Candidatus Binatia bacterium]
MSRTNLLDLDPVALQDLAVSLGAKPYRGRQLAIWLYQKDAADFEAMSDLPKPFRAALAGRCFVGLPAVERATPSDDGSRKLVLRLEDGARIQAVLMPDEDRLTLCVSTQVGCGFGCAFCLTGTMGAVRDLAAGEIVGQVLAARRGLDPGQRITHVVYMGMGEPLANYAATVTSLRTLTDARGLGFSPRRITVSTVGLVPALERLGREALRVNLAISLHAATDEVRGRLMPINRGFPIADLIAACRRFPLAARQRITFEYVLLDGMNASAEDARRLVSLLRGLKAKVNLIPFNDWPGAGFQRPPLARILGFQAVLLEHGVTATVRWSKGEDIGAACGQLKEAVPA